MSYWDGPSGAGRAYHHTAPVNAIYGLHEALVVLFEEGLEGSHARHRKAHLGFAAGVEALGLALAVPESRRLPQLNFVEVPDGVDEAVVRARMLDRFGVEIGAGLGPSKGKVWRVGLMGASATPKHVRLALTALADGLSAQAPTPGLQAALDAAESAFG